MTEKDWNKKLLEPTDRWALNRKLQKAIEKYIKIKKGMVTDLKIDINHYETKIKLEIQM